MNCKKCGNVITNLDQVCPNCGEPNELYTPVTPEVPATPVVPVNETPVEPVAPAMPETPVAPVTPVMPEPASTEPIAPVAPEIPVAPVMPEPIAQTEPVAPVAPEMPAMPETPVAPVTPVMPEPVSTDPVTPVEPVTPEVPDAPLTEEPSIPMQNAANPLNQTPVTPAPTDAPVTPQKPKKNGLFVVVIIVLILIIAGLGGFIGFKMLNPTNNTPEESDVKEVTPKPTETVKKKETMTYGGLTFTIPSGLTKKTVGNNTVLVDTTNGYMIIPMIITDEVSLNDVKSTYPSMENEMKTNLESKQGTYIGASEYILTGRTYYGISFYYQTLYTDAAYSEIGEDYLFGGQLVYKTASKDVAYKAYNEFLSSAELSKTSTFAKTATKENVINKAMDVVKEIK